MGYTTNVTGEFAITPPLTWGEFKDSEFAPDNVESNWKPSLILRTVEERADTRDGATLRITADALMMREIDEYRAYGLIEEAQRAVDSFPGHTFTGRLECEGEENTDLWRVVIRDGKAVKVEPRIVWPEDS